MSNRPADVLKELNVIGTPNIRVGHLAWRLPEILRSSPPAIAIAAFFGHLESFRVFVDLGADLSYTDASGRRLEHFVVAGGDFRIIRDLDSLGAK